MKHLMDRSLAPDEYAARRAWARRRGRPRWLWPEVEPGAWRGAMRELEKVAGHVLTGTPAPAVQAGSSREADALCLAAYTSGLGPWLGWQVEQGSVRVDAGAGREFALHLEHGRRRWLRLEAALRRTLEVLGEAGTAATVLKGAHTALRYFPEPGLRPMSDLDLYVASAGVGGAEHALAEAGYREIAGGRLKRPYRSGWRAPGAPEGVRSLMLAHADDGFTIDLHGTLDIDFFGVRTVAFGEPRPARLDAAPWLRAGTTVLAQPLLAGQLAVHAAHGLHGLTLIRQVELVLLLRHDMRAAGDWSALNDLLHELDAARFAFPALALVEKLVPGTVQPALLRACEQAAPPRLRRVVAELTPAGAQRLEGLALAERFMWGRGVAEHLRRMGNMLVPGGPASSLRGLALLYGERAYRLLRSQVRWRER